MEAIKVNINDKILILPMENAGMLKYRNWPFELVEVETITNSMEDFNEEHLKITIN